MSFIGLSTYYLQSKNQLQQRLDAKKKKKKNENNFFFTSAGSNTGKNVTPLKAILAGGISGGLEICISYPTEYIKTILQLDEKTGTKRYKGIGDCMKKTYQSAGITGFYRGLSPLFYMSIPKVGVRFTTYETVANYMKDESGKLTRTQNVICGLLAGVSEAILVVTPMETIKVKFIHDWVISPTPQYKGFVHGVVKIVQQQGFSGIYKGLVPTIAKQGTNQMIRFFVYGELVKYVQQGDSKKELNGLQRFICGALAGSASVIGNTPIDVVKTRMQGLEAKKYRNSFDCAYQIARKEGLLAFYSGVFPRLIRVSLDVATVFLLYHEVTKLLDKIF